MSYPLPTRFLREAEERLGATLPPGYANRMCRENGGAVVAAGMEWELYPIRDATDRKRLARTAVDIVRQWEDAKAGRSWNRLPPDALAVGGNGGGDELVLRRDAAGAGYGHRVFWWDHETGDLHAAADGFEDLPDA